MAHDDGVAAGQAQLLASGVEVDAAMGVVISVHVMAQVVFGRERNKRIDFEGESDFRAWYGESRANAAMVLDAETEPGQVISLVTCSYNIWVDNERTVLVTSMQETAKNQAENTQIAPDAS